MEAIARSQGGTTAARTISEQPEMPAQIQKSCFLAADSEGFRNI